MSSPLMNYTDELTDIVIAWYKEQIHKDYTMHSLYDQLLRSATSIGANVAESQFSQSPADYNIKMYIALKEASETRYWVKHLTLDGSIGSDTSDIILDKVENILNILASITNRN